MTQPAGGPTSTHRQIVDCHHHLWGEATGHVLGPRYLLADFAAEVGTAHHVTHSVFVECGTSYRRDGPEPLRSVGETEFAAGQAAAERTAGPVVSGIVANIDLSLGAAVAEIIDAHEEAGHGRLRGVRCRVSCEPANPKPSDRPGLLADPGFRRGLLELGRRKHPFDTWVEQRQLPELAAVARAAEGTTFVLNHLGGPMRGASGEDDAELHAVWRAGLVQAARCPNVLLKIGGLGLPRMSGMPWRGDADEEAVLARWGVDVEWCIDTFGPQRCMFESNFPVDRAGIPYRVLWNAYETIAAGYTGEERDALFAGTAARTYRIELSGP